MDGRKRCVAWGGEFKKKKQGEWETRGVSDFSCDDDDDDDERVE